MPELRVSRAGRRRWQREGFHAVDNSGAQAAEVSTMTRSKGEQYTLLVEALPGWSTPAVTRLRALLKAAIRQYGLRCVEAAPTESTESGLQEIHQGTQSPSDGQAVVSAPDASDGNSRGLTEGEGQQHDGD